MGGAAAGEVASAMAAKALDGYRSEEEPERQLKSLLAKANTKIFNKAASEDEFRGMGTTATAAVVEGDRVVIAHVGDSRAYLWRGKHLSRLTEDHSLVGEMLRLGQLDPADAETHPQRSIITRALGVDPEVEIDTLSLEWKKNDLILLCSDGLYSMVPDDVIEEVLRRGDSFKKLAGALVDEANARGGRDNITVVLFDPETAGDGTDAGSDDLREGAAPEKKRRMWPRSTGGRIALIAALVTLALAGGAWLASRQFYYLGVANDRVVIYRGVPLSIGPLDLYSLHRESDIDPGTLQPYEQQRLGEEELYSRDEAERIMDNLRRGLEQNRPPAAVTDSGRRS